MKKQYEKGYKVVREGDRFGVFCPAVLSTLELCYQVNKPTRPKPEYGPLCVFKNLKTAQHFGVELPHRIFIFQCSYLPSKRGAAWTPWTIAPLLMLPKGTVLADEVVLLQKVTEK